MITEQDQNTDALSEDNFLSMSDEDFANYVPTYQDSEESEDGGTEETERLGQEEETSDDPVEDDTDAEAGDLGEDDSANASDDATDSGTDDAEVDDESEGDEDSDTDDDSQDEAEETTEVDYQAEYEKVFAPFKANGKEMKVESAEDVRQLMQMGANYNKKMAALKPNLKMLKMLENQELLSEEKLSYLIDLSKHKPDAIQKLFKDSGTDPLEFDQEKESEYKPSSYAVDDRQIELDTVLDEIQDTPTYSQTISLVSNKWDRVSKQTVADAPQLLKVINDHIASGIYDQISTEVEKERMLGRLSGMSDLDAYRQVGDAIQARGGFDDLAPQATPKPKPEPKKALLNPPKAEDPRRKSKKRAASSTRQSTSTGKTPDFNPLALSDEEFEKLGNERLM